MALGSIGCCLEKQLGVKGCFRKRQMEAILMTQMTMIWTREEVVRGGQKWLDSEWNLKTEPTRLITDWK